MLPIVGILVVIGCVVGGYILEHGNLATLWQPIELLIICGAAAGALIISSPPKVLKATIGGFKMVFANSHIDKAFYMELLGCVNAVLSKIRKEGLISIEQDVENPETSPLFKAYPAVLHDHHLIEFMTDNLKIVSSTTIEGYRLDALMEMDIDAHHAVHLVPAQMITKTGDALPGLGIVAAVLGVVLTMGKIKEPPEVLGNSIGAALVGTFLGILFSYGFFLPFATNIEHKVNDEGIPFQVVRTALVAFINGSSPQIAVEFGRRAIGGADRPTFQELESYLREKK
ncbi:MAG: flagellar motor stator protein MotA [Bradymonadia bacterium]|jgi:chemotaxis protein MotA